MPLLTTRAGASAFGLGWSAAIAGEELGGMVLLAPTSVNVTGTSPTATINPNGSVSVATASSVSLNGVFSEVYDNYMVTLSGLRGGSGASTLTVYYRSSGVDTTTSTYTAQSLYVNGTSITASRNTNNIGGTFRISSAGLNVNTLYLYGPYLAQPTAGRTVTGWDSSGAFIRDETYTQSGSTQFDGFTIYEGFGLLYDITISVYGLVGA